MFSRSHRKGHNARFSPFKANDSVVVLRLIGHDSMLTLSSRSCQSICRRKGDVFTSWNQIYNEAL